MLATGLVLLYALASARSLVPGMCATQAALANDEAALSPAFCCARMPASPEHGSDEHQPLKREYPRCAFCQLALGICAPTSYASNGLVEQPGSRLSCNEPATIQSFVVLGTNVGRDPPRERLS